MTTAFIHGLLLSFSLIIPLGAQNVFIFTQGATQPRFIKVVPLVVIAALCDTALILLAVLGVSVAVLSISWIKTLLICSGVLFLGWIGWSNWQASLEDLPSDCENNTKSPLLFALSVSLLNPHAILDTIGVIGTNSLSYHGLAKNAFMAACIGISWLWFFLLATAGRLLGSWCPFAKLRPILNRVAAIIIWLCAIYMISLLFKY